MREREKQDNVHTPTIRQQVRRVFLITLVLNLAVAIGKIVVGLMTGALAITADGFHSLMDGASNIVALVANYVADQPPDEAHPYGHRRFETLAALLIGVFLILVAWEVTNGAINRLQNDVHIDLTPAAFAVLVGTFAVNIGVSTYQIREGKRLNSELLLADAQNTRADVFVTLSVIASMAVVAAGGWVWIDTVAALVVVVLIGRAALRILRQTGNVLVDTAPYPANHLTEILQTVPGGLDIARVRSRGPVDATQIDVDVRVAPDMTAEQTAAIAGTIRSHLESGLEGVAEVMVRFVPDTSGPKDYASVARAAADALGLATHEVAVIDTGAERVLDMHVEVTPGQTLQQAHELVSRLEKELTERLPDIQKVVTHIEPAQPVGECDEDWPYEEGEKVRQRALALLREQFSEIIWHDLRLYKHESGITLTMHATFYSDVSVEIAHAIIERAETLLRTHLPQLSRVTIHPEPPSPSSDQCEGYTDDWLD